MEVQNLIQYVSYLLIAIGIMAFLVSAITQVIKSWPGLDSLPTSVVVIVLSLILCPVIFIALMSYLKQPIEWYMLFFSCIYGCSCSYGWLGTCQRNMEQIKIQ